MFTTYSLLSRTQSTKSFPASRQKRYALSASIIIKFSFRNQLSTLKASSKYILAKILDSGIPQDRRFKSSSKTFRSRDLSKSRFPTRKSNFKDVYFCDDRRCLYQCIITSEHVFCYLSTASNKCNNSSFLLNLFMLRYGVDVVPEMRQYSLEWLGDRNKFFGEHLNYRLKTQFSHDILFVANRWNVLLLTHGMTGKL